MSCAFQCQASGTIIKLNKFLSTAKNQKRTKKKLMNQQESFMENGDTWFRSKRGTFMKRQHQPPCDDKHGKINKY